LEWLKKEIALSKFITCSEDYRCSSVKKPASIMRQRLRLGAVKRQFSGCLFVFPYDPAYRTKLLLGTKPATHKFPLDAA
jgi:hypothetical protein